MTIKAEDFILKQGIKMEDIDYQQAEELVRQIKIFELISQQCYTVFDYYKNEFYYITEGTDFFSPKFHLGNQSYNLLIDNFDEEDLVLMQSIQKRAFQFLQNQNEIERTKFIFSVIVRMNCNGKKVDTNYRVKPQLLDKKGNIWLSLAVLAKAEVFTKPQVINIETKELHLYKPLKVDDLIKHTKQEVQILQYMSNGLSEEKICSKLKIKSPTYKRHRRNIYNKLGADTKLSAINRAFIFGMIK